MIKKLGTLAFSLYKYMCLSLCIKLLVLAVDPKVKKLRRKDIFIRRKMASKFLQNDELSILI